MQWTPSARNPIPSDYTSLPQLSLSHSQTTAPILQPTNEVHTLDLAHTGSIRDMEETSQKGTSDRAAFHNNASPSELRSPNMGYFGDDTHRTSEWNRHHQSTDHKISGLSPNHLEQSELSNNLLPKEVDGLFAGTPNIVKGQRATPSPSTLSGSRYQEVSQALLTDIKNGVIKPEEMELVAKDRLWDMLRGSLSSHHGIDQAALSTKNQFKCDQCHKILKRHCDLK